MRVWPRAPVLIGFGLVLAVLVIGILFSSGAVQIDRENDRVALITVLLGLGALVLATYLVGRELQARHSAEAEAQRQREWCQTCLASIGDAVIITDAQGRVSFLNEAAQAITGWKEDGLARDLRDVFPIFHETTGEPLENPHTRVMRVGSVTEVSNHTILRTRDGREVPIDESGAPIRNPGGAITGVVLVFRDATERRQAESRLRYQLELTQTITDNATTAVFMTDAQGRCTFMNPAAEAMTGFSFAELEGTVLHDRIHHTRPDGTSYPIDECPIDRALHERSKVRAHEDLFVRKDGVFFLVMCAVEPIVRDGVPVGTVIEVRDITAEKQIEQALRESEQRSRTVVDHVIDGIITIDEYGLVESFNRAAEKLFGYQASEVVGKNVKMLMPEPYCSEHDSYITNYVRTGEAKIIGIGREVVGRRKDGSVFPMELAVSAFHLGGRRFFTGIVRDVTERKRMGQELRQRADALADADRRKDEFLAMLAHELRNPLAPIRNALHLIRLSDPQPTETVRESYDLMERQVEHLVRLVDDLLDVSRITRGKIQVYKERVDLAAVVTRAVESSRPLIEERRHLLEVRLPDEPMPILADTVRLAQVLLNLLNNAAKYTPEGGRITLTVQREPGEVAVHVRDTGLGIPPEMLPRVFDLFTQVDRTLERAEGGLGIGLTLVRRLTEMHGGSVEALSDGPGQGSEFVVHLPMLSEETPENSNSQPHWTPRDPSSRLRHILVVDDNRDSAISLAMLLRLLGNEVRTAHDGPEALSVAAHAWPDVVLLDIGLPGMDGYEVARQIRSMREGKRLVIVALTGYGTEEDRRQSHAAGFDAHLVKPVDLDALQVLLARSHQGAADVTI